MPVVAIIGSGFGGLASAIRLQARGFQVHLFEKGPALGGHAAQLKKDGYTFDMGPSLITAPEIVERVFQAAGKKMQDYLDLVSLDPFYRIYFHDSSYLDYSGDAGRMKMQMANFNRADAANYDSFMEGAREIYNAVIRDGMGSMPFMDWGTMLRFMPKALRMNALLPAYTFVKRYFQDPRHRFTFSFHPLFIGGSPFRAPSVYLMIPYLEKAGGVWFAKGGMYSLVEAFEKIFREQGGTIHKNAEVRQILVDKGRAAGVRTDEGEFRADAVVSNADIVHTYKDLVEPARRRKWSNAKLQRSKQSMSAFLLYMGVRKRYPELLHHTLILSERYKSLVKDIFDRKVLPDDFSMYLHVPTRTDPDMAPPGCESMYVLVPVANLNANIDWKNRGPVYAEKILEFLEKDFGLEGLRANLDVLEVFSPEDFARERNSYLGSPWGFEPSLLQTAYFRPHNRSEDLPGLYFVGAGTHPGAGVPGVLLTAETTESVIIRDFLEMPEMSYAI